MRKLLFCIAALAMLLVVSGQGFAVNRQVSINFAQGTNQVFSGGQLIGPYATDSTNWNNSNANIPSGSIVKVIVLASMSHGQARTPGTTPMAQATTNTNSLSAILTMAVLACRLR